MQRSNQTILLFGLLLAGGAAAYWWLETDRATPPPLAPGERDPQPGPGVADAPVSPLLQGETQDPDLPAGAPRVRVEVRALETYFAPPSPVVAAVRAGDGQPLAVEVVGGTGHGFGAGLTGPARAGLALAIADWPGTGRFVRQFAVTDGSPVPLTIGARLRVEGMIYDEAHRPLGGAHVWLGELLADGSRREVASDSSGAFELDVAGGDGVPFVAMADGRASAGQFLTVQAGVSPSLQLAPEAVLRVQFAASSDGLDGARVFVVPRGAVTTELAQFPFWLQSLTAGNEVLANGGCLVRGLPQSGDLGVVVWQSRLPFAAAYDVQRQGATAARAIVQLPRRLPEVSGRLVGDDGAPLAGAEVWSLRPRADLPGGRSLRLLPAWLDAKGACLARSDANGAFAVGAFGEPGARIALRAPGRAGRDLEGPLPAEPIVLPRWRGGEPSFHLLPPRAGVAWGAVVDLAGGVTATVAADRPWVVALPQPGGFAFTLVTTVDGVERARSVLEEVVVTGPVEIAAPRVD